MDQRQTQSDAHARKAHGGLLGGGAQNHQQKHGGQHHLGHQRRRHIELARRVVAIAIGGQIGHLGAGLAAGNEVQRGCRHDGAQDLGNDVAGQLGKAKTPRHRQTDGDRRVEVAAGDGAEGVSARQHRQAEGKGHAQQADAHFWKGRCQHRAATTAKRQPESTQKLRRPFFDIGCHDCPLFPMASSVPPRAAQNRWHLRKRSAKNTRHKCEQSTTAPALGPLAGLRQPGCLHDGVALTAPHLQHIPGPALVPAWGNPLAT